MNLKIRGTERRGYAYLVADADPVVQARQAVRKVIAHAIENTSTGVVKVSNVDSAISSQWCQVFPLCCARTSIKLELPIIMGDIDENNE